MTSVCRYTVHRVPSADDAVSSEDWSLAVLAAWATQLSSLAFLWQNSTPATLSPAGEGVLQGQVDVSDSLVDEWVTVWLLKELTAQRKDAAVTVSDEDGEFLLIEGADVLPRWLTPDNAERRVWIYQGDLHLIPLGVDDEELSIASALSKLPALASAELHQAVWSRLEGYPASLESEHTHYSLSYLQRDVAELVARDPTLVPLAVKAFYEREPRDIRAASTMERFPPRAVDQTPLVRARITRPLFSQLVMQRFFPTKAFLKADPRWSIEVPEGKDISELERRDMRWRDIGMKLTSGFEMLYQQTRSSSSSTDAPTWSVQKQKSYATFLERLKQSGFFGAEIDGSAVWQTKEKEARAFWLRTGVASSSRPSFAQQVDGLLQSGSSEASTSKEVERPVSLEKAAELESDEQWLERGGEDDLDGFMGEDMFDEEDFPSDISTDDDDEMEGVEDASGKAPPRTKEAKAKEKRKLKKMMERLKGMSAGVEGFVEGQGSLDGAMFDDDKSSDDDDDDDESEVPPPLTEEQKKERLDKLVPGLEASEWGRREEESEAPKAAESKDGPSPLESEPIKQRPPKLAPEKYDGASSDSGTDSEDGFELGPDDEPLEKGEDAPMYVLEASDDEDEQLDKGEEEEFLRFAREALGLGDAEWEAIVSERKGRGAYVPPVGGKAAPSATVPKAADGFPEPTAATTKAAPKPTPISANQAAANGKGFRNPNLASFDALMNAMDTELSNASAQRQRQKEQRSTDGSGASATTKAAPKAKPTTTASDSTSKKRKSGKQVVIDSDSDDSALDSDDPDLAAMDAELANLLKSAAGGAEEGGEGLPHDYGLVKNFLESFNAQGGFAGPAGNLVGRMGMKLPRDA